MSSKKFVLTMACAALLLPGCMIVTAPSATKKQESPVATNNDLANKAVTGVNVSQSGLVIQAGKSGKIVATVKYADGSSDSNVELSSDDTTIAGVNPTTGEITALKQGETTIRAQAKSDPSKFAVVKVSVKEGVIEDILPSISPENPRINVGQIIEMTAEIKDSSGKVHRNGSWSIEDPSIAAISGGGKVTGLKRGMTKVTFTSDTAGTVRATTNIFVDVPAAANATPVPTAAPTAAPTAVPTAAPSATPSPAASAN